MIDFWTANKIVPPHRLAGEAGLELLPEHHLSNARVDPVSPYHQVKSSLGPVREPNLHRIICLVEMIDCNSQANPCSALERSAGQDVVQRRTRDPEVGGILGTREPLAGDKRHTLAVERL